MAERVTQAVVETVTKSSLALTTQVVVEAATAATSERVTQVVVEAVTREFGGANNKAVWVGV
jgi:hypothetical protein